MQKTIAIFIQRCKKWVAWLACYFFTKCAIHGAFTQSHGVFIPILGTFVLFTVLIFQGNSVLVQNFRFLHGDRNFINKFSLNLKSRIEMWKHEHNTKLRLQSKWGRLGVEMLFNSGKTRASRLLGGGRTCLTQTERGLQMAFVSRHRPHSRQSVATAGREVYYEQRFSSKIPRWQKSKPVSS